MQHPIVDLGEHHRPAGTSDRAALAFTKALRWCAVPLEPNWRQAG